MRNLKKKLKKVHKGWAIGIVTVLLFVGVALFSGGVGAVAQITGNGFSVNLSESAFLKILDRILPGEKALVEEPDGLSIGAIPGLEILDDNFSVGQLRQRYYSFAPFGSGTGSSTVCSVRAPNATTTPLLWFLRLDSSSSTVAQVEFGTDDTFNGTTTSHGLVTLTASTQATIRASTTPDGGTFIDDALIVAPLQYYNINMGGGSDASNFLPTGRCVLQLLEI